MTPIESQATRVSRRDVLLAAGGALLTAAFPWPSLAAGPAPTPEDARLLSLFDRIHAAMLAASPELANRLGKDTGALRGELDDRTVEGQQRQVRQWKAAVAELRAIDRSALSQARAMQHAIAVEALSRRVQVRERYPYGDDAFFAYRLTQFTGAYSAVPNILDKSHAIRSATDVDAYLSRLTRFARALDQETERQSADARAGVVAPDFVLDLVLDNLRRLRRPDEARKRLVAPLEAKAAAAGLPGRSADAHAIVERWGLPALDRQIAATQAIRRAANGVPGVWRLPDGEAFYADALRHSTTSDMTPAQAHATGLEKVREIEARLDTLLRRQGYAEGSCAQRIEAIKRDPAQYFPDDDAGREALLAYFAADVARVQAALRRAFATVPADEVEVQRMPASLEGLGPSAAYVRGAADGSRAHAVIVDLEDMSKWPRFSLKTLCRHEGIPGHHLQSSLMHESGDAPELLGLFGSSAYGEGWALYSEQLSQEMGLYEDDPLAEIGMWQSLLYRAARIVVDTGLHHARWSRTQAVDYMVRTTAMPRAMMEAEVNRYAIIPGQACGYMLGQVEWMRIREKVRQRMGKAFDLRHFHEILRDGPMPMAMLEAHALRRASTA